jgi:caffeoyl-CoA O-methyltransferase
MDLVDPRIDEYAQQVTSPHEALLAELSAETIRDNVGPASMLTGPVAGRFLELLVWGMQPRRVLEIGTLTGHSALAMAAALPDDGRLDACELDPVRAAVAQRNFDRAPYGSKITLHVGPALDTIARLEGEFDFVFLDADKDGYVGVLDGGGPIVHFNDHVAADPRSVQVLLTVRDGITLIRRA